MSTSTSCGGTSLPPPQHQLRVRPRDRKAKRGLARLAVFQHYAAGVRLDQPASDGQPQPGAITRVGRAFDEAVEESLAHRGRHAGTAVEHPDRHAARIVLADPHPDWRARRRETIGVVEQVVEDLPETVP